MTKQKIETVSEMIRVIVKGRYGDKEKREQYAGSLF